MDSVMNQLARELAEIISTVVADDARVEACREHARAAGFDMRVALDAAVTFVPLNAAGAAAGQALVPVTGVRALPVPKPQIEMTANDRRFLKSLRISADEATEKEVE
ncbi:MAG: hypothetical protein FJW21_09800 [Acidimicrobiia bacterium]|nr:hypothetical protein [Acidimicrobiia bacterium]